MSKLDKFLEYHKKRKKISCITAYDASMSKFLESQGVNIILVGDSLGQVIKGKNNTHDVTFDEIIYHTNCVKSGINKTISNCIIVYPADDFENAKLLDEMYKYYTAGYDVICPSRFMKGGIIKNCPLLKFLIVRSVSLCLLLFSNLKIKDPTNGFRFFSRSIINEFPIESIQGFAYSLELLVKAKKSNKYKILEIPSIWIERDDRKSNFKIIKWSRQYLKWFFLAIFK